MSDENQKIESRSADFSRALRPDVHVHSIYLRRLCIFDELKLRITFVPGRPPDFIAFVITILMMLLMAAGVKKSLVFNNVLNAINLAVWVFVMAAGMFYVDSDNWSEHSGFLPYGWSGVSIARLIDKV